MMLINANALHIPLADKSVHMVVTSPPYWGLRDYGISGQLGLEATPEEYVANMIAVFREVWRVLRDDGTCWLNLGDGYAGSNQGFMADGSQVGGAKQNTNIGSVTIKSKRIDRGSGRRGGGNSPASGSLKPKDLVGIPWRVAFALQAEGWYLRSDIIWSKPNPMPESVTDRPTKSHEYLFLLAKRAKYYYDQDAVREGLSDPERTNFTAGHKMDASRNDGDLWKRSREYKFENGRNRRTVWTIATQPYSGSHFATFPEALVEPCVKAGTSERGVCPVCGALWVRMVEADEERKVQLGKGYHDHSNDLDQGWSQKKYMPQPKGGYITIGWQPTCNHDTAPIPAMVFDPFAGSGTVGVVCQRYGRRFVGLDLSMPYLYLAKERIAKGNGYHVGRLL